MLTAARERLQAVDLKFETVSANLDKALGFASRWHEAYLAAGPLIRRHLNQAIFSAIYVGDEGEVRSRLAQPFSLLFDPTLARSVVGTDIEERDESRDELWQEIYEAWRSPATTTRELVPAGPDDGVGGLKYEALVRPEGLEPPTF
jgi:hypothetical protein